MRSTARTPLRTRRTAATGLALAAALALTGCGGSDGADAGPGAAATVAGVSTTHGEADIAFVEDMVPHHDGALAMAELAATRAASPQVKELAQRIAAAQGPEIERMAAMAKAWGVSLSSDGGGAGGGHGGGHGGHGGGSAAKGGMGMDMEADMAALEPLSGAAFDREFLRRMIVHHEGALPMAQAVLDDGENPQAKALATEILRVQQAEIDEMRALLTKV